MDNGEQILQLVSDLPVMPEVYTELLGLLGGVDVDIDIVVKLTERDVGLTSVILRAANSPFYGGIVPVRTVRQAIVRVGLAAYRSFVLSAWMNCLVRACGALERELWEHSIKVAETTRLFAKSVGGFHVDEAYVWGIFHDVGWVVLWLKMPEKATEILSSASQLVGENVLFSRDVEDLEREICGCTHSELGRLAILKWELEADLANIVGAHHAPVDARSALVSLAEHILSGSRDHEGRDMELLRLEDIDVAALRLACAAYVE